MSTPNRISGGPVSAGAFFDSAGNQLVAIAPVKATGAEVDTGTNDAKFATPKAIKDSKVVKGAASGLRINGSATPLALDGSNPTSFAHGLTTCVGFALQLVGSAAPGDSTSVLTGVVNGANIDVYGWKNTGGTDPTLVASTGTETFNWLAWGT